MSHEKSFSKYINNSISKRQIVIHQTAFFYGKLLSSFLSGPFEIFKIKGTDSFFFYVWSHKSSRHLEKSSQRNLLPVACASGEH